MRNYNQHTVIVVLVAGIVLCNVVQPLESKYEHGWNLFAQSLYICTILHTHSHMNRSMEILTIPIIYKTGLSKSTLIECIPLRALILCLSAKEKFGPHGH